MLCVFIILLLLNACKPHANDILKLSFDKCQSINNGYYEMDVKLKMMSNIDTFNISHSSYFKKMPEDAIYSFAFHSKLSTTFGEDKPSLINLLYTGNEMVYYTDETESIAYRERDILAIKNVFVKNPAFRSYMPITNANSSPMLNEAMLALNDDKVIVELIGMELVNNVNCYRIKALLDAEFDLSTIGHYSSGVEYNFWIDKSDYLPIQFSIKNNYIINNDSVDEFSSYKLIKYEFNNQTDSTIFTLKSLPYPDRLTDEKVETTDTLKEGSMVPNWETVTLDGETINQLSESKLTLLNFFYAGCPPCIELHPFLDDLKEQFESNGLKVIGVSYIDTFSNLKYFKEKHNIGHTIGKMSEQDFINFEILAFPTTFLINQDGIIIHKSQGNYDDSQKEELINKIMANI